MIDPTELQSHKANSFHTKAPPPSVFGLVKGKCYSFIYDNQDDFDFEIVKFPYLMEMSLARLPFVYIFYSCYLRLFVDESSLFYSAAHIDDIPGIINHDIQLLSTGLDSS